MSYIHSSQKLDKLIVNKLITVSARKTVESVTAATTLNANDSGKMFVLSSTSAIAVTLPTAGVLGAGWTATFVFGLIGAVIHTVGLTDAANINGSVADTKTVTTPVPVIAASSSFVNFTATAVVGDQFTLTCDGTTLFLVGSQQTAAAISVTA